MSLEEIGELGLIDRLSPGCLVRSEGVVLGIGDDCAVTRGEPGRLHLVTTDLLVERVDFLRDAIAPRQLGAKALAVNLSDIAAMGGTPLDAFVSIAVPEDVPLASWRAAITSRGLYSPKGGRSRPVAWLTR